jgi:hypothetical protein|tara:strand:+ start:4083 stop:5090 length:1008 start_codon:yes stop_codon:yes gene_type:complete
MNTTLVTAIYYGDREGELGGRCWREQYYFSSFQNIYNFGCPAVIYCDKDGYPKLKKYFDYLDHIGHPNKFKLIVSELGDFKFKKQIISHRKRVIRWQQKVTLEKQKENPDEPGFFHARCEILCHRKMYWVKEVAEDNPYDTENFLWVDSGITHWGLNPKSMGGVEINNFFNKKIYYPYNKDNMYTPKIGEGINNLIDEHKYIGVKHGNLWYNAHHVKALQTFLQKEYGLSEEDSAIKDQVIGGVMGIHPSEFKDFFSFYEKALLLLCKTKPPTTDFFTEEIILSAYHVLRKQFCLEFQEWNHDVKGDPSFVDFGDEDRSHIKCFYKIWNEFKNYA